MKINGRQGEYECRIVKLGHFAEVAVYTRPLTKEEMAILALRLVAEEAYADIARKLPGCYTPAEIRKMHYHAMFIHLSPIQKKRRLAHQPYVKDQKVRTSMVKQYILEELHRAVQSQGTPQLIR